MYTSIYYEETFSNGAINKYWFELKEGRYKYSNGKMLISNRLDDKKIKRINFWAIKPILNLYRNGKLLRKTRKPNSNLSSWKIKFDNGDENCLEITSGQDKNGCSIYKKPLIIKLLAGRMYFKTDIFSDRVSKIQ